MMDTKNVAQYVEKHRIFQLFEDLLQQLILHKPEDPIEFLIHYLGTSHGPKIIITGPPRSGKTTHSKEISDRFGVVYISLPELLKEAASEDSGTGHDVAQYQNMELSRIPDELLVELLKRKLQSEQCKQKGWLVDGFPFTRRQALALQSLGILPDHFIVLQVDEARLKARQGEDGKLQKDLYNYNKNIQGVTECYKFILKKIDANCSPEETLEEIVQQLNSNT